MCKSEMLFVYMCSNLGDNCEMFTFSLEAVFIGLLWPTPEDSCLMSVA